MLGDTDDQPRYLTILKSDDTIQDDDRPTLTISLLEVVGNYLINETRDSVNEKNSGIG